MPGVLHGHNHIHKQHTVGKLISALVIGTVPDVGTESTSQLLVIIIIVTQVILAFWLVLAYDLLELLEDRRTDDDSARFKFFWIF